MQTDPNSQKITYPGDLQGFQNLEGLARLPYQISIVYESMLPRQPLRFVLAGNPGAGKTIMAGLPKNPFNREPEFAVAGINYDLEELLSRATLQNLRS